MSNKAISIYAEALKRRQEEEQTEISPLSAPEPTPEPTRKREGPRGDPRGESRDRTRAKTRDLPTRDEIQEFSFSLRDELKVKVQAEVPHHWQGELEEIARQINVKKLELYRFILGEFLQKVKRKGSS